MVEINCTQCGSDKIMQDLKLSAGGGLLIVTLEGNPGALVFKDMKMAALRGTVCGECGNVGLSIENPKELWETYKKVNKLTS